MNIEVKKYNIIQLIMSVADEQLIDQISSKVQQQNYQGIDAEKMYRLIKEADIQEPIEDLLKMI